MIIGIDGNEANVPRRVGVSVYTFSLLNYFKTQSDSDTRFRIFLRSHPLPDLPTPNKYFSYEIIKGPFLWSQIFLPIRLFMKKNVDVFFSPAHYSPRFCPVPGVVTIHDVSYLLYPEDFLKKDLYKLSNWTAYSIHEAKKIISVSKTTKKDIITYYSVPDEKIDVIYNGYEKNTRIKEEKLLHKELRRPYILYVGTLQPRKNIEMLLDTFSEFNKLHPVFELIIAGKKGWLYDRIYDKVSELALDNDVYFTDFISDHQLAFLYKNAFCLVLPSLYEGFGLPVLEAMSYGCPVISSFSSSLPEIGGDACLYFDPKSRQDLLDKLLQIKENTLLRKELIQKGKQRAKEYSWIKCGESTLSTIKKAAYG